MKNPSCTFSRDLCPSLNRQRRYCSQVVDDALRPIHTGDLSPKTAAIIVTSGCRWIFSSHAI